MAPRKARVQETEPAAYADVVRALKARGFGAEIWGTGGGIDAVAATIDGGTPDYETRHLLITCTDGDWLCSFENGDSDHDMTGEATCVSLVTLPADAQGISTATAEQVADQLADLVVSLLGPANSGARALRRPRAIRHRVRTTPPTFQGTQEEAIALAQKRR